MVLVKGTLPLNITIDWHFYCSAITPRMGHDAMPRHCDPVTGCERTNDSLGSSSSSMCHTPASPSLALIMNRNKIEPVSKRSDHTNNIIMCIRCYSTLCEPDCLCFIHIGLAHKSQLTSPDRASQLPITHSAVVAGYTQLINVPV